MTDQPDESYEKMAFGHVLSDTERAALQQAEELADYLPGGGSFGEPMPEGLTDVDWHNVPIPKGFI